MKRAIAPLLCLLFLPAPGGAATLTSTQNGEYYCPGNTCAFSATPGVNDTAVIQHDVTFGGGGTPPPANPFATGAVNLTSGTFGIYGGMRLVFGGGTWSGGALDSCCNGGGVFVNVGVLDVTAASLPVYRNVLENNGTMRLAPGSELIWNQGNGGGSINNKTVGETPALLHFDDTGSVAGAVTINSEGIARKSGTGTVVLNAKLRSLGASATYPGAIEVAAGTLAIADADGFGGSLVTEGGNIDVADGAVLAIRDGGEWRPFPEGQPTQTYTTTGTGAGKVRLESGGSLYGTLNQQGNVPTAVIDFPPGMFEWRGGQITAAHLRNEGEITIEGPDAKLINAINLDNAGVIKLQVPLPSAGILTVLPQGLLEVANDTAVFSGGTNPRLIVDGTLRKLAGAGTFTLTNMTLEGSGTVEVEGGHLALPEVGSFYRMANFRGTVKLIANAAIDTTGVVLIEQSAVTGVGTVNAPLEQRARLEPGAPFGAIQVAGYLQQNNTAITRVSIGGTAPVTQSGQVQVTGDLYALGTLQVNFRDGYAPNAGDAFDLITVGGNFLNGVGYAVQIEGLEPGLQYSLTQSPQKTVRLTALNHVESLSNKLFADGFEGD